MDNTATEVESRANLDTGRMTRKKDSDSSDKPEQVAVQVAERDSSSADAAGAIDCNCTRAASAAGNVKDSCI